MPVVSKFLFKRELHQLLARRAEVLIALSELNHCKAEVCQVLRHLDSTPAVKCDFTDMESASKIINEIFDKGIVNDIPLCDIQKALSPPKFIRHMISSDTQVERFFRKPEIRQKIISVILRNRRKDQNK